MAGRVLNVEFNEVDSTNRMTIQSGKHTQYATVSKQHYDDVVRDTGRSLWGMDVIVEDGVITVDD